MGYSLGGGVALRAVVRHPDSIRKLVLLSIAFKTDGWYPAIIAGREQCNRDAAEALKDTPLYELYASIEPRPGDWPVLVAKMGELARQHYDWSKDIAAITTPTLLVFGDADAVRPAHAVECFELLGGGRAGRRLGRLGNVQFPTRHSARCDALQRLLVAALPEVVAVFLDAHQPIAAS